MSVPADEPVFGTEWDKREEPRRHWLLPDHPINTAFADHLIDNLFRGIGSSNSWTSQLHCCSDAHLINDPADRRRRSSF